MTVPRSLFLVGPMGAGKTTIGRYLARALELEFIDVDAEIVRRAGADIPWIFDMEGEEGFRQREHSVVEELTRRPDIVLATGGGAVQRTDNRAALRRGFVIYLHATVEQQLARTRRDRNRPLLRTDDPQARLRELMTRREPLYRELADLVFVTDRSGPRRAAREIASRVGGTEPLSVGADLG